MWSGEFTFGEDWAAYCGASSDHRAHAHAAVQIAIASEGSVKARLVPHRILSGPVLIIGPLVRHQLDSDSNRVTLVYLEPTAPLAARLLASISPVAAAVAPPDMVGVLRVPGDPAATIARLSVLLDTPVRCLDPRLDAALTAAARDGSLGAVARAAASVGLSMQRVRALAATQLRVPLSQWLLWRKLDHAGRAIAAGATLADAAAAGGFADQAHMTRTMRHMFGVTPGDAAVALRRSRKRFIQ